MADEEVPEEFWKVSGERIEIMTGLWLRREAADAGGMDELARTLHTFKGEAYLFGLETLGDLAERIEDLIVQIAPEMALPEGLGDAMLTAFEELASAAIEQREPSAESAERATLLLDAALMDLPEVDESAGDVAGTGDSAEAAIPGTEGAPASRVDGVEVERLQPVVAELRRFLGERVIMEAALRETQRMLRALLAELDPRLPAAQLAESLTKTLGYGSEIDRRMTRVRSDWSASELELRLLTDRLAHDVDNASMVAVSTLYKRAARLVRATAKGLDKRVSIETRGDAYLPIQTLRDLEPILVHLIRNAVDHGIERPEVRVGAGKDATGSVRLDTTAEVGWVRLSLSDDGRGVDVDAIRQQTPDSVDLPDEEVLQLMFRHGVSTRDGVTAYSGRGVGLDVVAATVARLGGRLSVESERGLGTRFILDLPTSLRASMAMPVTVGRFRCALPVASVEAVLRAPDVEELADGTYVRATTHESSKLVPLSDLRVVLGDTRERGSTEVDLVVLVTHRDQLRAFIIDGYESPRSLPIEPIADLAFDSPVVVGAGTTPVGLPILLLSPEVLLRLETTNPRSMASTAMSTRQKTVLIAEDAPVARELLAGLLRSFGLRVLEAEDGQRALELLEGESPDLVVTDIEMPRVSGLQLMAEIRSRRALASVPIVVLTTRTDAETRRRTRELGAQGFISKRKFVESELREVVDRCLANS